MEPKARQESYSGDFSGLPIIYKSWMFCFPGLFFVLIGCRSREERAASFVSNGNKHRAEENLVAAKIEYSNALQADPYNLQALDALSQLYERDEQLPEVYKTLHRILQLDENNLEARLRLANLLAYTGSVDEALVECDKLLAAAPNHIEALLLRAGLLFRRGGEDEAIVLAEKILKLDAGNTRAPLMLARHLSGKNQHQQALQILNLALALDPNDRLLSLLKISTHDALGQSTEAHFSAGIRSEWAARSGSGLLSQSGKNYSRRGTLYSGVRTLSYQNPRMENRRKGA